MGLEHVESEQQVDVPSLMYIIDVEKARSLPDEVMSESVELTSITVNEHGKCRSASFNCALCTLPRILAVPTPLAIPANRLSTRRMILDVVHILR